MNNIKSLNEDVKMDRGVVKKTGHQVNLRGDD